MLYNDEVKAVSLGISKIALRRDRKQRSRVEYLIDPGGDEASGFGVPEKVVLQRWRQKTSKKYAFGGIRFNFHLFLLVFFIDKICIDFVFIKIIYSDRKLNRTPNIRT